MNDDKKKQNIYGIKNDIKHINRKLEAILNCSCNTRQQQQQQLQEDDEEKTTPKREQLGCTTI